MTLIKQCILSVVSDHLHRRETTSFYDIDWEELITLAINHEIGGILFYQCKSFIPDPYKTRMMKRYASELYAYQNRVKLFNAVSTAFLASNIPFFTVKGLNLAEYYPLPTLRTMGDCDIIVHEEDKQRAHDVFMSLGFKNEQKLDTEWTYFKHDLEFELHHSLLYDEIANTDIGCEFCEKAWEYIQEEDMRFELDWNFHYIFLILHLHKHLINAGVGLRQFIDLYVVEKNIDLDWNWIDDQLANLRLLDFKNTCSDLIRYWFDNGGETTEIIEKTEKILGNGIFGFQDDNNRENRKVDLILSSSSPKIITRIKIIIASVFPSYRTMRYVEHYSFLNGRPYLLPAFWFYRFYRAVKYKMVDNGKQMIDNAMVSRAEIDKREQELKKWGL